MSDEVPDWDRPAADDAPEWDRPDVSAAPAPAKEKTWWERGAVRPTTLTKGDVLKLGEAAAPSFKEGFGDQPLGSLVKPDPDYPKTSSAWQLASVPPEIVGRTISGGVHVLGNTAAGVHELLSGNPDEARRFGREVSGMAESRMLDVGQHVPKPHAPPTGVRVPEAPLEGEVLQPGPPGGPAGGVGGIGREGPAIEGEWYSPATPRPELKVGDRETKLLPHDYQPEPDTMGRYGVGAAAAPGGPLHGMLPETLGLLKEDLGEFTPGTLGQRLEDMSPHMPFAHISEQTRGSAGGLYAHPGQSKVEIYNTVNQLARERPERLETVADRAFGPAENTIETQKLLREEKAQVAAPFWERFRNTPIEPTQRLASLEPRLRKTGAWKYAEEQLGIEGASTTERARFPEEEGSEAPTPAFYEVVRQGLNKKIARLYSEAGDNSTEVARLVKLYNEVTDAIDTHPDQAVAGLWKEGRDASGRYAKALEAMATGERLMTQNIHEYKLPEILERYDDWQKEYLVKGVRKWLGDQLGKKGTGLATINNILTGPVRRKIIQVIGQEKAEALFRDLEHERDMIDYEPDLIGNKRTGASAPGRKLQADRFGAPEGGMSDALGKAGNFIRHPIRAMTSTALEAGQRALDTKAAQKAARIREELARVHTLQGPERDAVARHLIGHEPLGEPSPRAPRPAPAAPEPARAPMNAMDATEVLRAHGWDQASINRLGAGETRAQVAKYLQEKHPNGPPPKPVADFPADREVGMPQRPPPAPAAMPESPIHPKGEKPLSLLEWIRKQGGISPDDPLVEDVRTIFGGKNPGGIIRKGGKSLDRLREGAVGEKYFLDRGDITGGEAETTPNTLLEAMDREVNDRNKQYPLGSDMSRVRNSKDMEARNREQQRELEFSPEARRFDREAAKYGVTRDMIAPSVRDRAIEMMRSGIERDALEAFERALSEQRQAEAQGEHAAEVGEGLEPSPQSGGMAARGERSAGEGQNGTRPDVRGAGPRDRAEKNTLGLPGRQLHEPERIVGASVVLDGKVFIGPNHAIALMEADRHGIDPAAAYDRANKNDWWPGEANTEGGFVTSHGRLVSRQEAVDVMEKSGNLKFDPGLEGVRAEMRRKGVWAEDVSGPLKAKRNEPLVTEWNGRPVGDFSQSSHPLVSPSKTRPDVRGIGERDRAEKEPLRLKVLERHRLSGRPKKVEPLRTGEDVNQAILEAGYKRALAPTFHSAVSKAIDSIPANKMQPQQWLATLTNKPGVKTEEMKWLGLDEWLGQQKGPVTKQQIGDYVRANQIEVKEVTKGEHKFDKPDMAYLQDFEPILGEIKTVDDVVAARKHNPNFRETFKDRDPKELLRDIEAYKNAPKLSGNSKFSQYQLPGGENYRELLLTLPNDTQSIKAFRAHSRVQTDAIAKYKQFIEEYGHGDPRTKAAKDEWLAAAKEGDRLSEPMKRDEANRFRSSHWDEPNVLAHVRFNDRTIDGKKTLLIEEVQSDWHQAGRTKGYAGAPETAVKRALTAEEARRVGLQEGAEQYVIERNGQIIGSGDTAEEARLYANTATKGVPDAPFKTTWPELSLKRMIRYAAENGYDQVAWTPGKVQAERYDLSKQISKVVWNEERGTLTAYDKNGTERRPDGRAVLQERNVPAAKLADYIGKEAAEKLTKVKPDEDGVRQLAGLDLQVGGEGMLGFYDKILPATANKLVKKFGARVGATPLNVRNHLGGHPLETTRDESIHTIPLTPALRRAALVSGFPQFRYGGAVKRA